MPETADAVVIGGGVYGTSIAWHLARLGAGRVVLVEKAGLAAGGSGRSSANVQFNYSNETLARIGVRARRVFQNFRDVTGGECALRQTGQLVLHSPDDIGPARANVAMLQRAGIGISMVGLEDVKAIEPGISVEGVGAAFHEPEAAYADPVLTASSYAAAARAHGAELRMGAEVTRITVERGRVTGVETNTGLIGSPLVVVAAGYRTSELTAPLGVQVPLRPERHTVAIIERPAGYRGTGPIVADRPLGIYFRADGTKNTLIGSHLAVHTKDDPEVEDHKRPDPAVEAGLVEQFLKRYPGDGASLLRRGYTGVYDCTPDLQFILGPVRAVQGLNLACGFSGHGFKFSPVIGELVAEKALTGGNREFDISTFAVERFAEGRLIRPEFPYRHQKT
jgi:glycine/D-amino acid oxidase-like deaminating enzyme